MCHDRSVAWEEPLGRDRELLHVDKFLDGLSSGPLALVLTGPAGIGKTTVWREGIHRAEKRGHLVLSMQTSQAEARLSFAGVADLFRAVDNTVFETLPAMQRHAMDVALLRSDAGSNTVDGRLIGTALLSVLHHLAASQPVLIGIDDAQWLDAATAEALAFAVRRLGELPVGVLVSVRVEGVRPVTFERSLPPERRLEVPIVGLNAAALHEIVKRRLDVVLPRPTLVRIVVASAGNPFYAVEIARELQRLGVSTPSSKLPVPSELQMLVSSRLSRLPHATREALLVASSLSRPTSDLVDMDALGAAEEAGIVHVGEGGRIRFDHPLLAAAVYESASWSQRRSVHRRLAASVDDAEERALHLANAANGPDDEVASALEAAARHAAERGATGMAAELSRRALELTPGAHAERGIRRSIAAAKYMRDAAESPAEARALLKSSLSSCRDRELRAELLYMLGNMSSDEGDQATGYRYLEEALRCARQSELRARIHIAAAWQLETDKPRAIEHCDEALSLVSEGAHPVLYSTALMYRAYLRLIAGHGADDEAVERGRQLQAIGPDTSPVPMAWPVWRDDFNAGRHRYEDAIAGSRLCGDELSVGALLSHLAELELWSGNWARADSLASEALDLVERSGSTAYLNTALYARGHVDTHLGRVESARAAGERILELDDHLQSGRMLAAHRVLGFLAISLQDPVEADAQLTLASAILESKGEWEPARFRIHPDHIEAVIQLGDLERAERMLGRLDARAQVFPRPWILATTARSGALLLSARGDLEGALAAMRQALVHHESLQMPFERARTLLALGQLLRRRGERREARSELAAALAEFERLGAPLWAERARAELARIPVRRAPAELTPTEEWIARLAAGGLTNREVAERAFISAKTVEANLARVYDKLHVHSRAELGRVMGERERTAKT